MTIDELKAIEAAAGNERWRLYDRGIGYEVVRPEGVAINDEFRDTFPESAARSIVESHNHFAALLNIANHADGLINTTDPVQASAHRFALRELFVDLEAIR